MGSSVNLGHRLRCYLRIYFLKKELTKGNSIINSALLKNGYSKFSLEILEYCHATSSVKREQYYLNLCPASLQGKPEYNILKTAGSSFGFKHSLKTKAKMSAISKGRVLTAEQKARLSEHLKRIRVHPGFRAKRLERLKIYLSSKENKEHLSRLNANPEYRAKRS